MKAKFATLAALAALFVLTGPAFAATTGVKAQASAATDVKAGASAAAVEKPAPATGVKWGAVDIARLMKESEPGKAGVKFIEDQQASMQKELDEVQDKLEKNPKDQALMQELQKTYAASQQRIQAEGQSVANQLFDLVQKALEKYRADNGYDMLVGVEALAAYNPALDVTDAVMVEVNKSALDLKAVSDGAAPKKEEAPAKKEEKSAPGGE